MPPEEVILAAPVAPPAVVLGLGINGLGIVRALGYRGVPVIGGYSRDEAGRFSRFLTATFRFDETDFPALLAKLVEIAAGHPGRPVLFVSSDELVRFIDENRAALERHYRFNVVPTGLLARIMDKYELYRLAVETGTPMPASFRGATVEELRAALAGAKYPLIAKPQTRAATTFIGGEKNVTVGSLRYLDARFGAAGPVIADFVFQEIIPIRDEDVYYCAGYYGRDGDLLGLFSARKLRQHPPRVGVTSFAVSQPLPEVRELAARFLDRVGYTGLFDIEFVRDARDGRYYLIEINPRTHQANIHATDCGVNLPYLCYRDLTSGPAEVLPVQRSGVHWVALELDVGSFVRKFRTHELDPFRWAASFLRARSFAYFSARDPGPAARKALSPRRNLILKRLFRR